MSGEPRRRSAYFNGVQLNCYDEDDQITAPPSQVLQVDVIADRVYLTLADFEETPDTTTTKRVSLAIVDVVALVDALSVQLDRIVVAR